MGSRLVSFRECWWGTGREGKGREGKKEGEGREGRRGMREYEPGNGGGLC